MPWQNLVDFFMSWLRISMLQKLLSKQVHDEKLRCTFFTCFTAARESAISSSSSGDDRPPKSLSLLLPLSIIIPAPQRGINQQAEERDKRIRKKKTLAWKEEEKGLFVSCCLWVSISNTVVQHFRFLAASGADGEWGCKREPAVLSIALFLFSSPGARETKAFTEIDGGGLPDIQ